MRGSSHGSLSRDFPETSRSSDFLSPRLRLNLGPEIEKRNHLTSIYTRQNTVPLLDRAELDQLRALLERFGFPPDGICPRLGLHLRRIGLGIGG